MSSLKDRLAQDEKANTDFQGDLKVVTDKLKITQGQLKKARAEAEKLADETNQKVTALDTSVHSELATKASTDDVKTVDTKVVGVRTDLDTTREDLKMAKSEMGTLIARNHDEIDQLRRLGERDYTEFTITGKNRPQKVANVTVELKGVNEKRNQFHLAMVVEDKRSRLSCFFSAVNGSTVRRPSRTSSSACCRSRQSRTRARANSPGSSARIRSLPSV